MLGGLTPEYDAMVLALENSNTVITSDLIKGKLLDQDSKTNENGQAFFGGRTKFKNSKCNLCGKKGHWASKCRNKKNQSQEASSSSSKPSNNHNVKDNNKDKKKNLSLYTALKMSTSSNDWFIDSGASTKHMTGRKDLLINFIPTTNGEKITTACNQVIKSEGQGDCQISCPYSQDIVSIKDVMYVPNLAVNLLSVSRLVNKGLCVTFDPDGCKMYSNKDFSIEGKIVATGTCVNGIYKLVVNDSSNQVNSAFSGTAAVNIPKQLLWHKRLAHLNFRSMKLLRNGMVSGVDFGESNCSKPCEECILGKQPSLPFTKPGTRATEKLAIVHTDLCGPMPVMSLNNAKYLLTFIDDYTRKTFIYFLKTKDEVFNKFIEFKTYAEKETNHEIKCVRSDNGKEFVNKQLDDYLKKNGIKHQLTADYTPQQNGVAERANRIILDKVRCMLIDSKLSPAYWAEACNYAVYLKNRSPSKAVKGYVPETKWSGKQVDLQNVRIFGCKAYAQIPKPKRNKLSPRSTPMIFTGICENTKAYRLINPKNPKIFQKSRNVVFDETSFFKNNLENTNNAQEIFQYPKLPAEKTTPQTTTSQKPLLETEISTSVTLPLPNVTNAGNQQKLSIDISSDPLEDDNSEADSSKTSSEDLLEVDEKTVRRIIPELFTDDEEISQEEFFSPEEKASSASTVSEERQPRNIKLPEWTKDYVMFQNVENFNRDEAPQTYRQAINCSNKEMWMKAMETEIESFKENNVWELVDKTPDSKVVDTKWVYKLKRDPDGNIERYKARLVAKGFTQREGIDFADTFSPVVRHSTMRMLFSLAAKFDLDIVHLDVTTAFLNGDLKEDLFIKPPEGMNLPTNKVFKLKKAIYGLKQSARSWNDKAHTTLINLGYKQSQYEPCVYFKKIDGKIIIIALYVDDFFIFHNHKKETDKLRAELIKIFKLRDLGEATNCLGLQISRNRKQGEIKLSHKNYILNLLKQYNMEDCKPVSTPLSDLKPLLSSETPHEEKLVKPYQQLIGSLLYLAVTSRPDIAYAVTFLSQFNTKPTSKHFAAAKRVLRYLKGSTNFSLCFRKSNQDIIGYSDADWANNCPNRKSFSGNVFIYSNAAISWECRKQATTSLSSTEAEYISLSDASKEAIHLKNLLSELIGRSGPIVINCDNQSALNLTENPILHRRTKHIDVKYHFIRDQVKNNHVNVFYVPDEEMVADALTKPVPAPKLNFCAKNFGLVN